MPYIDIKITREAETAPRQKAALIQYVTELLADVLGKSPAETFVVIHEVALDDRGVGGLLVQANRDQQGTVRDSEEPE